MPNDRIPNKSRAVVSDPVPQKPIQQLNEWTSSVICAHKSSRRGRSDGRTCGNCKHARRSTSVLQPIKGYYSFKAGSCCFRPTSSRMAEGEMNASCDNFPISSPHNRDRSWSPTAPSGRRPDCGGAPASLWAWLQHTGMNIDQTEPLGTPSNQRHQTLTK